MRTKTLLLAVVLGAASVASSMAQVYSVNAVGYVNTTLSTGGFHLLCNPLNNTAGNDLNHIIPSAPIGTTIYRFSTATGYEASTFIADWQPNFTFAPGEGFFVNVDASSVPLTFTFVGDVMQGNLSTAVPQGFSLKGMQVPQALPLDDPTVNFPADIGDTVYFYRNGAYISSIFIAGFNPPAVPGVGEGFFVSRGGAATSWTRTFSVN
jgi:hypothetical protein